MLMHLYAFIMGFREYRLDLTMNFDDCGPLDRSYDRGRALASAIFGEHS